MYLRLQGQSPHVGKGIAQVVRQAVDHLGAPAFTALTLQDRPAHIPIQEYQRLIRGQHDAQAFSANAFFELCDDGSVALRQVRLGGRGRKRGVVSLPASGAPFVLVAR